MEIADRFLDDLLAAVKEFPDPAALKAAAILKAWDKKTECNDRGAILFAEWCDEAGNNMYEIPWDRNNPVSTPEGLKDRKKAVALLGSAYNKCNRAVRFCRYSMGRSISFPDRKS